MEMEINTKQNVYYLNLLLKTLNDRKIKRTTAKQLLIADKILKVYTKECKYVGGKNVSEVKPHLTIIFTSLQENGIVHLSIPLENITCIPNSNKFITNLLYK